MDTVPYLHATYLHAQLYYYIHCGNRQWYWCEVFQLTIELDWSHTEVVLHKTDRPPTHPQPNRL